MAASSVQTVCPSPAPPRAPAAMRAGTDVAPLTGWRRLLGDWILVGGTTTFCHALGAVTSLLLRIFLQPAEMGIWQAVKLLWSYGNYANLGISKGAARELTVAIGRGETSAARRGLNLAFTVNTLTSLLYAGVLAGVGIWIGYTGSGPWAGAWAAGLVAAGGLAAVGRYVTFHVTLLRSKQAFVTTSGVSILEAVLTLAVCVTATWFWGLPGLYGGTLVVLAATLIFVTRHRAFALAWAFDGTEIRRLIAVGFPILLAGTVGTLLRSLDKLMILGYLSDREFQLGCYSLTLMVTAQVYGLGNMLAMVMGPRYGETYGHTGDRRQVARLAARATELQAAALGLPAALAIVAAPPILIRLLPDYRAGLAPLVWLVPGAVAMVLALPSSQYLVAVNRQTRALAAVAAATVLAAVGNHLALAGGYGLSGVAAATASAYLAYFVLAARISIWTELESGLRRRWAGWLAWMLMPVLVSAVLLQWWRPGQEADWPTTAAKVATVTLVWLFTVTLAYRRAGWREAFRPPSVD